MTVLDVTLGLGGHAECLLEAMNGQGRYIGLDADERNLAVARERLKRFGAAADLRHANFRDLPSLDLPPLDLLLADLGLSSPHIDDPERGFSFRFDGPLDMRFDAQAGEPASEKISEATEEELTNVLRTYGELPQARRLALTLKEAPPATTSALKAAVEKVCGWRAPRVLPQVFQALRIWVNDEMGALDILLENGPKLLQPGGRMAVISYHSLEDRPVKHAFRRLTTPERDPVTGKALGPAPFTLLTKKPVRPSPEEEAENPRSRSAVLRAIRRS